MLEENKKRRIKMGLEQSFEFKTEKEDEAIKEKKNFYTNDQLIIAIEDLSLYINNAYFKAPFNRCPNCNKGNNTVLAHFGTEGPSTIGNLRGFGAVVGDVIAWSSATYKGISIVKGKNNGVFQIEGSPFINPRKEPAVIERMIIPEMYREVLAEMAQFLADYVPVEEIEGEVIGKNKYPYAITKRIQKFKRMG